MRHVISELKGEFKMSFFTKALFIASSLFFLPDAHALDLDWHGQFRAETNWLFGYSHGNFGTPVANTDYGYFIPSNGESPAQFQNLFLRLNPRVIVNDNVSLHSDLWLGSPDRGMFGANPTSNATYGSTRTGGANVTANELYAEIATDFGTITVGRAPLNWGLGVVWNNNKNKWDRLPSTGDTVGMVTKLGAFKLMPAFVKYSQGSNFGGTTGGTSFGNNPSTLQGSSGVSDYTVGLTYTNDDEQVDLGLMFMRRVAGQNAAIQNPFLVETDSGTPGTTVINGNNYNGSQFAGYAYNIWDFYVKKQAGIVTLSGEVPLVSGTVSGTSYSSVAAAVQAKAQFNDKWALHVNTGMASGQENVAAGTTPPRLNAFYFHPDYRPGFLMFNYNYRNLSNSGLSPYNSPITDAKFLSLSIDDVAGKFTHTLNWLYAVADKTANGINGEMYFNTMDGFYHTEGPNSHAQSSGLGWELDYTLAYDWDEAIRFSLETGLYVPGKFYEYNDSTGVNNIKTVFGSSLNFLVKF